MAKSTPPPAQEKPSDLQFVASALGRIFLLGALGLAVYLGVQSLMNGSIAGCTDGGGCHEVISSKWGYFFGVPVSLFGALIYSTLLGSDFAGCCPRLHSICRWMILLAAGWFFSVQIFILGQFCPWCCVTHTLACLGALCLWKKHPSGDDLAGHKHLAPALGLMALAGLIAVQSFGPERPTTAGGSLAEGQGTQVEAPKESGPRKVSLHGGKFSIDVAEFPAIGNTQTAPHVAVGLFDFTCPHCRHLHEKLTKLQSEFGDQLAIVQLPGHFNAKGETIHKLMLALWKEDPESYHEVAALLHEGSLPASETEVRTAIGTFVNPTQHEEWMARHNEWSSQVLANSQAIRETNRGIIKTGKFPQLMIGDYVEAGSKSNPGHYYQLFKEKFGLERQSIPQLTVDPTSINLGNVYVGAATPISIKLRNPGGPPVQLSRPELIRGMRLKKALPKELASGQETTLEIEALPPTTGEIGGDIHILSDAEPAKIKVPVKATAVRVFTAKPALANLGIYMGQPLSSKVEVTFIEPVQIGTPRSNNPNEFRVAATELEPGLRYELTVIATPKNTTARVGIRQASISLPVRPKSATAKPWPRQIRITARCQVPSGKTTNPAGVRTVPGARSPASGPTSNGNLPKPASLPPAAPQNPPGIGAPTPPKP